MRVLTADEMREVDRRAIEEIGIPSLVLMENAAIGVADAIAESFPEAESVAIFCGPGNNGGDGLALARLLDARGYRCGTFLVLRSSPPRGDAAVQWKILERAGIPVEEVRGDSDLAHLKAAGERYDLLVDALFGTGLTRPLEGHFAELVEWLGSSRVPCLAVDLPSGLDGSRAEPPGPHVRADLTVTFAALKVAHVLPPAADACGALVVTDLGIPPFLVAEAGGDTGQGNGGGNTAPKPLHLSTDEEMATYLMPRPAASHKGTYGHALIVAGAPGRAGAAILAARAAVRGGAGLVTAAVPEPLLLTVDGGSLESLSLALPADAGGALTAAAADAVLAAAADKSAVALGPGIGLSEGTVAAVRRLYAELDVPVVFDADGLNAFAGRLEEMAERRAPAVLTPHPGEAARLLATTGAEVQADRLGAARRLAEVSRAVVLLKGHLSLVATPDGDVWINPTGNPGMASGGSGDVLTGLVAALLAQGYDALVAAQIGAFLHGLAGDLALTGASSPEALIATDLLEALPAAFAHLRTL